MIKRITSSTEKKLVKPSTPKVQTKSAIKKQRANKPIGVFADNSESDDYKLTP